MTATEDQGSASSEDSAKSPASATVQQTNPSLDHASTGVSTEDRPGSDPTMRDALRHDIHLLGDLLGEVIRAVAGDEAFDLVEELRAATKKLRVDPSVDEARDLVGRLSKLELPVLRVLIRAFSTYFDLINLAEQQARVRALRRRTLAHHPKPVAESLGAALATLAEREVTADQLHAFLDGALVCAVFTAHPTEARRRTILEKLRRIAHQLDRLERETLLPAERQSMVGHIHEEIEAIWMSDVIRGRRPSVRDEITQGLRIMEPSLLETVPKVYRDLESAIDVHYPDRQWAVPAFLRFGTWMGGDRDGNPFVTPKTTVESVSLHQSRLLRHYLTRLTDLQSRLSHSRTLSQIDPEFDENLKEDLQLLGDQILWPDSEPFRQKCQAIALKIQRTLDFIEQVDLSWSREQLQRPAGTYLRRTDLLDDVGRLIRGLDKAGAHQAAIGVVKDLYRLVDVFGLHFLTLDIRQHAGRHTSALAEVFQWANVCPDYEELNPRDRQEILDDLLLETRPVIPAHLQFSDQTNEVIETFRTIAGLLHYQCPDAINKYIISMANYPSDVLEVLLLAKEAGLYDPQKEYSAFDIVPLFETLSALERGEQIVEQLLNQSTYRQHVEYRDNLQEIMIGYSDSNKECGFLQSAWSLYQVEPRLAKCAKRFGVDVQIFHGRGGAVGRGGGPANRAILAQPSSSIKGRMRTTEQGEVISDRYGHTAIAERHLNQVLHAVLVSGFPADPAKAENDWGKIVGKLADLARQHYQKTIYDDPEFIEYFQQATPIFEISQLRIGSRPARRSQQGGMETLRAIPWVFSWMQSRHTLPGWFGFGTALETYLQEKPQALQTLQEMYQQWAFWRMVLDNVQMILAKADMTIARLYADLVENSTLGDRIYDLIHTEYSLTVKHVLGITNQSTLLGETPVLRKSINQRNPYVDSLSYIQLVLLRRLRHHDDDQTQTEMLPAVLESISGIASGLKNTG